VATSSAPTLGPAHGWWGKAGWETDGGWEKGEASTTCRWASIHHLQMGKREHRGGRGGTAEGWGGIVKVLLAFGKLPLKHN